MFYMAFLPLKSYFASNKSASVWINWIKCKTNVKINPLNVLKQTPFPGHRPSIVKWRLLHGCKGISVQYSDDDIFTYFKILVLLYADDTVLFAETETVLQNNLNIFKAYCDTWKLNINYKKTKIMIFGIRNIKKIQLLHWWKFTRNCW